MVTISSPSSTYKSKVPLFTVIVFQHFSIFFVKMAFTRSAWSFEDFTCILKSDTFNLACPRNASTFFNAFQLEVNWTWERDTSSEVFRTFLSRRFFMPSDDKVEAVRGPFMHNYSVVHLDGPASSLGSLSELWIRVLQTTDIWWIKKWLPSTLQQLRRAGQFVWDEFFIPERNNWKTEFRKRVCRCW